MRLANLSGRLQLVFEPTDASEALAVDVARASGEQFSSDPQAIFARWDEFTLWANSQSMDAAAAFDRAALGPPVPRPSQLFAIGINYAEHAAEAGYAPDAMPVTFTKFPSCLTGPDAVVTLPLGSVDWEVELVIAISREAHHVDRAEAWAYVAGLTVGQDLSEREIQLEGAKPQFSLGKSFPGFGPTGPWLVTADEFENPADLEISCSVSGDTVQRSRTSHMVYDIPELIARLSAVCTLMPGDLIFTGTPAGVGNAMTPKRFLGVDDVLVSTIEGIGTITTTFA